MTNYYYSSMVRQIRNLVNHEWFYKGGIKPMTVEKLFTESLGASPSSQVLVPDGSHGLTWGFVPVHDSNLNHTAHAFFVLRSTAQTIPDSTITSITFTAESFDQEGHFTASSTNIITSQAGVWIAGALVAWTASSVGPRRYLAIFVDGNEAAPVEQGETGFAPTHRQQVSDLRDLTANQTWTVRVFQDTGGDLDITGAQFWGALFGPLP